MRGTGQALQSRALHRNRDPPPLPFRGPAMSFASVSRGYAAFATALLTALLSAAATAQTDAAPVGTATEHAAQPTGPLKIWVDAPSTAFDKARLQESLSHE